MARYPPRWLGLPKVEKMSLENEPRFQRMKSHLVPWNSVSCNWISP